MLSKKVSLANLPTPIHLLRHTSIKFGIDVYIKRDDMTGCVESGNKIRKQEYLIYDVLEKGCDTVVTDGSTDSNCVRATAVACVRSGLGCTLILYRLEHQLVGNLILDKLLGVDIRYPDKREYISNLEGIKDEVMSEHRSKGRKPYWIPNGASVPIGALGYVNCIKEISDFERAQGITFDRIYFASGSGGTGAGIIVGKKIFDLEAKIVNVRIGNEDNRLDEIVLEVAKGCAGLFDKEVKITPKDVFILDGYNAGGYSIINDDVIDTIKYFATKEGILLDPIFTAKCGMGLLGELKNGQIKKGEKILFIHTGGIFSNYTYHKLLLED